MTAPIIPTRWQTSGRYLIETLRDKAGGGGDDEQKFRLAMDVFIKQRSYAILNKIFFYIALAMAVCVALWPVIAAFLTNTARNQPVGAAVVQTTITGFGAFAAYVYNYYKKRQTAAENLLRLIAFSPMPLDKMVAQVIDEMSRLDQGIGFSIKESATDGK
jgi:hypothetical protein